MLLAANRVLCMNHLQINLVLFCILPALPAQLHGQPVPAHGRKRSAEEQSLGLPELVAAAQVSELAGSPPKRLRADEQASPVGRRTQEPEMAAKMVPETARLEGLPAAVKHEVEQLVKIETQRVFQHLISRTGSSKELPLAAAAAAAEEATDGEKLRHEAQQHPGPAIEPINALQQPGSSGAYAYAGGGSSSEEVEHLRTKLATAYQLIADLEVALSRSAAQRDAAALLAEQRTAKRIRAAFPEQLKQQMKIVPAEQQQHVALFFKLSIGALEKLVSLYV